MRYMKKYIVLLLMLSVAESAFGLSFNATNPGAVNMMRYYQTNPYNYRRSTKNTIPYVYSEQQAKYYGINVVNPNTPYRTYGGYSQRARY